nr:chromosome segregation protein SMC [Clostridiales bacterium]
ESLRAAARESESESKKDSESIAESEVRRNEMNADLRQKTHDREELYGEFARLDAQRGGFVSEREKLVTSLWDEYELTPEAAAQLGYPPVTEDTRRQVSVELSEAKAGLRRLGDVNIGSIDELRDVQARYDFLTGQRDDLVKSRAELADIVGRLEKEMRARFVDVFETISENFRSVFRELFGGGDASLKLTDPSEPLESGIEIEVAPPGKVIKTLSLLSGGEQAFAAIALFFAIIKVNPTPFCILDEIEAALDDVNVARFAEYCRRYSDRTQFIAITHRRGTMEACDRLYGVTMAEKGVSTVLTLDLDEAERKIGSIR